MKITDSCPSANTNTVVVVVVVDVVVVVLLVVFFCFLHNFGAHTSFYGPYMPENKTQIGRKWRLISRYGFDFEVGSDTPITLA